MREYINKMIKKVNNSVFDVAAAPMYIAFIGLPVLFIVVAALICFFAVRAIIKISREKKAKKVE
ncbi:MAG: hypothetical protein IJB73_08290 [Firmicutes bacterium]|nr:hypothetical protein [Bacillota bacterium]